MKITAKRLRQIITEEVIKEELEPEHAVQAISHMLRGMTPEVTSDVFGDTFNTLYGEEALEAERQRQAAQAEGPQGEEEFPTEYQAGGAHGDRPIVGIRENLNEIIQEELEAILEDMASTDDIKAIRQRIGEMSYQIEQMLIALLKAGYSMEDIMQMGSELKRMDPHLADIQVAENKDNPWAICTESVGRKDKEKYEKCVMSVKKEKGIK
jgi:hypothetical protein